MSENLKRFIGEKITIQISHFIDGSNVDDYIQGILRNVENDILFIEQHIPFCNLFEKDGKTVVARREIHISNIKNGIKTF